MSDHDVNMDADNVADRSLDRDELLASGSLDQLVRSGELSTEQAAEILQSTLHHDSPNHDSSGHVR
ncbi:MAG: hypothetical protein IT336_04605 [Thermomicrobiales bacterium]|nr:hypothetical protein [Thermomicrobiales bacterium]